MAGKATMPSLFDFIVCGDACTGVRLSTRLQIEAMHSAKISSIATVVVGHTDGKPL
jgi:hypothetical protein